MRAQTARMKKPGPNEFYARTNARMKKPGLARLFCTATVCQRQCSSAGLAGDGATRRAAHTRAARGAHDCGAACDQEPGRLSARSARVAGDEGMALARLENDVAVSLSV